MGIRIRVTDGHTFPAVMSRQFRRYIIRELEDKGSLTAISAQWLAVAVAWCEEQRVPYSIKGFPGSGIGYNFDVLNHDTLAPMKGT